MIERKGTKRLIEDSFIELLSQKSIKNVTVSEIAENCGISDRTFYYYFHDKFELVEEVYSRQLGEALEHWGNYELVLQKSAMIIDEFGDFVVRAMERVPGVVPPIDRMAKRSSQMYIEQIRKRIGEEAITDKLVFQITYFNYLTLKAMYDWAKEGKQQTTDAIAEWVMSCMPRDLEPYLNDEKPRGAL